MKIVKVILIIISALLFEKNILAQGNLVPNYSFEFYTTCPTASGQITLAAPWYGVTSGGSTDYFNSCASSGYGVPKHGGLGYQFPKTGNAYAGIWVFSVGANYREYLQVQMSDTLLAGSCYRIEYYVNLFNSLKYALRSVDAYLSISAVSTTGTGDVLSLSPQISKFNIAPIDDTLQWVKISGLFIANGSENYITIGNFYNDANTDTINTGSSYYGSYYYVDDVSVIPIDSIVGGMLAFAGNDTLIAQGDSIFIGQEILNLNCNWYDEMGTLIDTNVSGIYVKPDSTTFYVVEQNLCGNITFDTIVVTVSPLEIDEFKVQGLKFNVYPNPANEKIIIETDKTNGFLIVLDVTGRILKKEKLFQAKTELDLNQFSVGVYFLKYLNKTEKLIIQK